MLPKADDNRKVNVSKKKMHKKEEEESIAKVKEVDK
jgi:hypothetical protein